MDDRGATDVVRALARLHPDAVRRRLLLARMAVTAYVVCLVLALGWLLVRYEEPSSLGHLSWQTPRGWSVRAADTGGCHIYPGAMIGPFLGTVRTGSMYHQTSYGWECSRGLAIKREPKDGVVAWVDTWSVPTGQRAPVDGGPSATGVCGGGVCGRVFHSFQVFTAPTEQLLVSLDGCAFGPRADGYLRDLSMLAASFRYQ